MRCDSIGSFRSCPRWSPPASPATAEVEHPGAPASGRSARQPIDGVRGRPAASRAGTERSDYGGGSMVLSALLALTLSAAPPASEDVVTGTREWQERRLKRL